MAFVTGRKVLLGFWRIGSPAQQQNHNDDDEQEADRAAANVKRAGKNGGQ
jgi:hypothetical protein